MACKDKCDYCGKEFEGLTEKQAEYQKMQHILSRHRDKLTVKEVKKK